jgi:VanZ family protein
MTTFMRLFAWLLAAAVTFATLGPANSRPHSNLGQSGEHGFAFVLIGLSFAFAYPNHRLRTAGVAVIMTGILELLQLWVPGRHARLKDFVVDAAATCIGFAIAALLAWAIAARRGATQATS